MQVLFEIIKFALAAMFSRQFATEKSFSINHLKDYTIQEQLASHL